MFNKDDTEACPQKASPDELATITLLNGPVEIVARTFDGNATAGEGTMRDESQTADVVRVVAPCTITRAVRCKPSCLRDRDHQGDATIGDDNLQAVMRELGGSGDAVELEGLAQCVDGKVAVDYTSEETNSKSCEAPTAVADVLPTGNVLPMMKTANTPDEIIFDTNNTSSTTTTTTTITTINNEVMISINVAKSVQSRKSEVDQSSSLSPSHSSSLLYETLGLTPASEASAAVAHNVCTHTNVELECSVKELPSSKEIPSTISADSIVAFCPQQDAGSFKWEGLFKDIECVLQEELGKNLNNTEHFYEPSLQPQSDLESAQSHRVCEVQRQLDEVSSIKSTSSQSRSPYDQPLENDIPLSSNVLQQEWTMKGNDSPSRLRGTLVPARRAISEKRKTFPLIADVMPMLRSAIASEDLSERVAILQTAVTEYATAVKGEYDFAKKNPAKCRLLARNISHVLELLHGLNEDDIDMEDYMYHICRILGIYIACELCFASSIKQHNAESGPLKCITNRISHMIHKYIAGEVQDCYNRNILLTLVFIPNMFKQRVIIADMFSTLLPKTGQTFNDTEFIQYMLVCYEWKKLETENNRQKVLDFAKRVRAKETLLSNSFYMPHLPPFKIRTAGRDIVENLKFSRDLQNATIVKSCPQNSLAHQSYTNNFPELKDNDCDFGILFEMAQPLLRWMQTRRQGRISAHESKIFNGNNDDQMQLESRTTTPNIDRVSITGSEENGSAAVVRSGSDNGADNDCSFLEGGDLNLFTLDFDVVDDTEGRDPYYETDCSDDESSSAEDFCQLGFGENIRTYLPPRQKEKSNTVNSDQCDSPCVNDTAGNGISDTENTEDLSSQNDDCTNAENDILKNGAEKEKNKSNVQSQTLNICILPLPQALQRDKDDMYQSLTSSTSSCSSMSTSISSNKVQISQQILSPCSKESTAPQKMRSGCQGLLKKDAGVNIHTSVGMPAFSAAQNRTKKQVKFNEKPIGPTSHTIGGVQQPNKPPILVNRPTCNQQSTSSGSLQRDSCASPASSTSSLAESLKQIAQKERMESIASIFSNYKLPTSSLVGVSHTRVLAVAPRVISNTQARTSGASGSKGPSGTTSISTPVSTDATETEKVNHLDDPKLRKRCVVVIKPSNEVINYERKQIDFINDLLEKQREMQRQRALKREQMKVLNKEKQNDTRKGEKQVRFAEMTSPVTVVNAVSVLGIKDRSSKRASRRHLRKRSKTLDERKMPSGMAEMAFGNKTSNLNSRRKSQSPQNKDYWSCDKLESPVRLESHLQEKSVNNIAKSESTMSRPSGSPLLRNKVYVKESMQRLSPDCHQLTHPSALRASTAEVGKSINNLSSLIKPVKVRLKRTNLNAQVKDPVVRFKKVDQAKYEEDGKFDEAVIQNRVHKIKERLKEQLLEMETSSGSESRETECELPVFDGSNGESTIPLPTRIDFESIRKSFEKKGKNPGEKRGVKKTFNKEAFSSKYTKRQGRNRENAKQCQDDNKSLAKNGVQYIDDCAYKPLNTSTLVEETSMSSDVEMVMDASSDSGIPREVSAAKSLTPLANRTLIPRTEMMNIGTLEVKSSESSDLLISCTSSPTPGNDSQLLKIPSVGPLAVSRSAIPAITPDENILTKPTVADSNPEASIELSTAETVKVKKGNTSLQSTPIDYIDNVTKHLIVKTAASVLKEATMTLLSFEATPTVPAYLFNGESRDVPTPTPPASARPQSALNEHVGDGNGAYGDSCSLLGALVPVTSDHEVSSTQETVYEITKRSSSTQTKIEEPPSSNAALMLVQNNQIDTTHHLRDNISSGRRRSRRANDDSVFLAVDSRCTPKRRRKTVCSEVNLQVQFEMDQQFNKSGNTSPSTTTYTIEKPLARRRGRPTRAASNVQPLSIPCPPIRRATRSLSTSTPTCLYHGSGLPLQNNCKCDFSVESPPCSVGHVHRTYSKGSMSQEVFVPRDIEQCLGLADSLEATSRPCSRGLPIILEENEDTSDVLSPSKPGSRSCIYKTIEGARMKYLQKSRKSLKSTAREGPGSKSTMSKMNILQRKRK